MKFSIVCLTVIFLGAQGFNAVGGNGGLRTQPFVPVDDQMHILPYPSEATPGEAHILPYYPDAKNNAVGVRSLPYPTGSSNNDEMRMQPVTSGQRATRQAADARNLPSYFPSNSANLGGFKTISAGAGTNGQVRILPKSTESDEMRIQPFPSGQRVTRRAVGDAQILPYFPNGKTSRPKTMPFPSGSNGKDQVKILPVDNGNANDDVRIQPIPAGNGDFNILPFVPRQ